MDKVWQGAALRRLRMLSKQSIQQVAEKVGVTDGAISQWELGMSEPGRDSLVAYAEAIGAPFDLLLAEIGYPMPAVSLSLKDWYMSLRAARAAAGAEPRHNTPDAPASESGQKKVRPGGQRTVRGRPIPSESDPEADTRGCNVFSYEHPFEIVVPQVATPRHNTLVASGSR